LDCNADMIYMYMYTCGCFWSSEVGVRQCGPSPLQINTFPGRFSRIARFVQDWCLVSAVYIHCKESPLSIPLIKRHLKIKDTPTWSLPGLYLVSAWSLSGLYLVSTWSLPGLYLVSTWSLPGMLPGLYLVSIWSLPGLYLGSTWALPGLYLVSTWSLSGLYLGSIWSLSGLYLFSTWALPGLYLGSACAAHVRLESSSGVGLSTPLM